MFPPLLLVGAGRMGGALLAGWQRQGLAPSILIDPLATEEVAAGHRLLRHMADVPTDFRPAAAILAVKPQKAPEVLPALRAALPPGTPVISIMAGIRAAQLAEALAVPIVRAMPNMPAAIGQGATACYADATVTGPQRDLADRLMRAVGAVVWLETEAEIDIATAVSGGGPAYVFLFAELLAAAAEQQGLPPEAAATLARATVAGAGALLAASPAAAAELRRQVTSPGGTTERALAVLMGENAWPKLIPAAIKVAISRARELG